jgi:subtilase-type serine protease
LNREFFRDGAFCSAVLLCICSTFAAHAPALADPFADEFAAQWGLAAVRADAAYAQGFTGAGVVIGIVDAPFNVLHPELFGRAEGRIYFRLGPFNWDFAPLTGDDTDALDYHGSAVAGVAAAAKDGVGMHGIAYDATLRFLQPVASVGGTAIDGVSVLNGLPWLIGTGVRVTNHSYGVPANSAALTAAGIRAASNLSPALEAAEMLAAAGVLPVFAVGNTNAAIFPTLDSHLPLPHLFPELAHKILAVTSTDINGELAANAYPCGLAAQWCLAAPGGVGTGAGGIFTLGPGDGYTTLDGTSFAAPHVTGAAALVFQAYPWMNAEQVSQVIRTTAVDIGDPGVDAVFGWGLLDADAAVRGPRQFLVDWNADLKGIHSTFANDIAGPGGLTLTEGRLTLSGTNSFAGPTEVGAGGMLDLTGSYSGGVTVAQNGWLRGSGLINDATNVAGGLLAEGLQFGNDLTLANTAFTAATAMNGPLLDGTGTMNLDGTLLVDTAGMAQAALLSTQLAQFAGGITGDFDTVSHTSAWYAADLDRNATTIDLNLAKMNLAEVLGLGGGGNDKSLLQALYSLMPDPADLGSPDLDAITVALLGLTNDNFSAATGSIGNGSAADAALLSSFGANQTIAAIFSRFGAPGLGSANLGPLAYGPSAADDPFARFDTASGPRNRGWINLIGARTDFHSGDRSTVGGIAAGIEGAVAVDGRLGLVFSAADSSLSQRQAKSEIVSYGAGLTASWTHPAGWFADAAALANREAHDMRRTVTVGLATETARGSTNGWTFTTAADVGRKVALAPYEIEGRAGLRLNHSRRDAYRETGSTFSLAVDQTTHTSVTSVLGMTIALPVSMHAADFEPRLFARWEHVFGDLSPRVTSSLGGATFESRGQDAGRDELVFGGELAAKTAERVRVILAYEAGLRRNATRHEGRIGLEIRY